MSASPVPPGAPLDSVAKRVAALAAFAREMISDAWDGGSPDGGDIQDTALRLGLLVEVTATEPCGEHCRCREYDDFPQSCYRYVDWLAPAQETNDAQQ